MFKRMCILVLTTLSSTLTINNTKHYQALPTNTDSSLLATNSLPLAFKNGDFYEWNDNQEQQKRLGIFTNTNQQSYLLNSDGTYHNLDLQISNFTSFNAEIGIATVRNLHDNDNDYINKSFLFTKNGIAKNSKPLATQNYNFSKFGNDIVSTGVGADLISSDGTIVNLVKPYQFEGYGTTSFTSINDEYGIFVANNQHCYVLQKNNPNLLPIMIENSDLPLIAPNPNLLTYFVALNEQGGIIRNDNKELFYLTIADNKVTTTPLYYKNDVKKEFLEHAFSSTTNFFTKITDKTGILNIDFDNTSCYYGQPYALTLNDKNNIDLKPIANQYLHKFIALNAEIGIWIDSNDNAFFVDKNLTFTTIGKANNAQKITNELALIDTNEGQALLSTVANPTWTNINTINFTPYTADQTSNFVNSIITYVDNNQKVITTDRTNNWVSTGPLDLSITNDNLVNVTIDKETLLPNSNNTITTTIYKTATITFTFTNPELKKNSTIIYHVLIYDKPKLPTLTNGNANSYQYVGIVNNNLFDITTTNDNAGFTINYDFNTTIQYVNVISLNIDTMYREKIWTITPNTTFTLNALTNYNVYLLETVTWNNTSTGQYFLLYRNTTLPIAEFWMTNQGQELLKFAVKIGYTRQELRAMNAKAIAGLRNFLVNWKISEKQGAMLGYTISASLVIATIIAFSALLYDRNLKKAIQKQNHHDL